jgi:hypothetical protein
MLSLMLFFASRNPVRNLAIVNAVIAGLGILALTPLLSFYTLDIQKIYPGRLVWGRSLVRLAIAALLYRHDGCFSPQAFALLRVAGGDYSRGDQR